MKSTIYLIWKNPHYNGENPEWQEISGIEFYALVKSPENKERCFVKLLKVDENDVNVIMEATKAEYIKWRKEKNHTNYLFKCEEESDYQVISYHAMEAEDGCFGEELMRDENCNVEAEFFKKYEQEAVRAAVARLSEAEQHLVNYFYLSDTQGTERGYAALTGIPQKTVHNRKVRILSKLKNFLEN